MFWLFMILYFLVSFYFIHDYYLSSIVFFVLFRRCLCLFCLPRNMLRVSFSPGRDRAYRHCRLFLAPLGKTAAIVFVT